MILAEWLYGDPKDLPACRPVDPPGQLAAPGHRRGAALATAARIVNRLGRDRKPRHLGLRDASAGLTEGVKPAPIVGGVASGFVFEDPANQVALLQGDTDRLAVRTRLVQLV